MIRKILHAVRRENAPQIVYDRYMTADDVLGTKVSPWEIIFPQGLKLLYLPFSEIQWAYIRTQAHRVTLGCCAGDLEEHWIVLVGRDGNATSVPFDRLSHAEAAMNLIREAAPHIVIGYTAENRARFESAV